jgi:hypothetical protein
VIVAQDLLPVQVSQVFLHLALDRKAWVFQLRLTPVCGSLLLELERQPLIMAIASCDASELSNTRQQRQRL